MSQQKIPNPLLRKSESTSSNSSKKEKKPKDIIERFDQTEKKMLRDSQKQYRKFYKEHGIDLSDLYHITDGMPPHLAMKPLSGDELLELMPNPIKEIKKELVAKILTQCKNLMKCAAMKNEYSCEFYFPEIMSGYSHHTYVPEEILPIVNELINKWPNILCHPKREINPKDGRELVKLVITWVPALTQMKKGSEQTAESQDSISIDDFSEQ